MEKSEFPYTPEDIDDKALNGARMVQIAKIAISDHNAKENTKLEFVEISKGDCDSYLIAGHFYHLSIKVKDRDSPQRELKILEKMIWKGSAMQVGDTTEVSEKPAKTPRYISKARIQKMVLLALDAPSGNMPKEINLPRKGVVVEEVNVDEFPKGKEGYVEFRTYNLYFTKDQRIFRISIFHKKWFDVIDDGFIPHICENTYRPPKFFKPLQRQPGHEEMSEPRVGCSIKKLHKIDLEAPFILSFAWYAIEEYNFKQCEQLEFMYVLKAEGTSCAVLQFELTIKVKDKGVIKVFNTKLWSRFWLKQVEFQSSLEELTPTEASKLLQEGGSMVDDDDDDASLLDRVTRSRILRNVA